MYSWVCVGVMAHNYIDTIMTRNKMILILLICSLTTFGQSIEDFKKDFEKALDKNFSEKELNNMFRIHSKFLTPHSDVTQLSANLKGQRINTYPLADFKNEKLYTDNIYKLINSKNSNQRILAYLVIASSGDTSFENTLIKKIKEEKDKGCLVWSGMALLYLNTSRTTPLFDFLVENETFGDAHMLPLFIKLNKDSLQKTAYLRINSDKPMAKILAAQILSNTQLNGKTEELLKKAVKDWDINIKGYAIYSVAQLQIGNLLETLKPLLDSSQTRSIALTALSNSPTENDRQYLYDLVNKQDTISEELLDCFYKSKNVSNLKYWLRLLYTKPIPEKYYFSVTDKQSLVRKDTVLSDVQTALGKVKNAEVLGELVRALERRTDDKSTDILLTLLTHENSTVRYWTAHSLKGNHSPKLIAKLPDLLNSVLTRVVSLTDLAIENNLDTLQSTYENIYKNDLELDWQRSCIEYLSTFPKERHKEIFKKILQNKDEDTFIKSEAALGLGKLKDESAVDLIISTCRQESEGSDYNAQTFLVALGMIKGNKAKAEIEKYKSSKEEGVRELVANILKEW
jgi:HEAT repeat protein